MRARWLLLLAASVGVSIAIVLASPNPSATLDGTYTDSERQIYSSWLFLRYGAAVFREPLGTLAERDASPGARAPWPQHPFIYPPGALVIFAPFGYAQYGLGAKAVTVNRAALVLLVLLAHASVVVLARELGREPDGPVLLTTVLYGTAALHWALNGFYDPVYVAFGALGLSAARRGDPVRALLWLGASSFFHFRALFYAPVALHQVGLLLGRYRTLPRRRLVELGAALSLAAASAWAFLLTRGTLDDTRAINLLMEEEFGWGGVAVLILVTLVTVSYALHAKERLTALAVAWVAAVDLALPFARAWHTLGLYPIVLLPAPVRRRREVLLLWVLLLGGVAFRYFPSLRWLARGLGLLF